MSSANGTKTREQAEGRILHFPDVRGMTRREMEDELARLHGVNVHAPGFVARVRAVEEAAAEAVAQQQMGRTRRWLARLDLAGRIDAAMLALGNVALTIVVGMYKYLGATLSLLIVFGAEVVSNWAGNAVFDLLSHDTIRVLSGETGAAITTELYRPVIDSIALVGPGWAIALVAGYYGVSFMLAGRHAAGHSGTYRRGSLHSLVDRGMYALGFGRDTQGRWSWADWRSVEVDRWDMLSGMKGALRLIVAVNGTVGRIGLAVLMVSLAEVDAAFFMEQQLLLYVGLAINVAVSFLLLGIADALILHTVVEHRVMAEQRQAKKAAQAATWTEAQRQAADREAAKLLAPVLLRARERMQNGRSQES